MGRIAELPKVYIAWELIVQFGQEPMFKQMQVLALAPQIHWILPTLICIRLLEIETLSKCAGRSPGPGLKGTAEGAGRRKSSLTRNVTDMYILLCQPLTRSGYASLMHESRMSQVVFGQSSLQGAGTHTQLVCNHVQTGLSGGQQARYDVADFID